MGESRKIDGTWISFLILRARRRCSINHVENETILIEFIH